MLGNFTPEEVKIYKENSKRGINDAKKREEENRKIALEIYGNLKDRNITVSDCHKILNLVNIFVDNKTIV